MQDVEYRMRARIRPGAGPSSIHHSVFIVQHSAGSRRAFSLLELVFVMVILAIIFALIVPQMGNFGRNRRTDYCATEIVAVAHWARTKAITDGVPYRLNVDPQQGTYWLTVQGDTGADFGPVGEEFGRVFLAPEGVSLTWAVLPPQQAQAGQAAGQAQQQQQQEGPYVEFRPDGRVDPAPAVIRLTDTTTGAITEISCLSATEMFRITAGARAGVR